jgi:hypothetical protein
MRCAKAFLRGIFSFSAQTESSAYDEVEIMIQMMCQTIIFTCLYYRVKVVRNLKKFLHLLG